MAEGRGALARAALALLLAAIAITAEPLVCRGFDAASAAGAIVSRSASLLSVDPALRQRAVWFVLSDARPDAARQALAHALGCWWAAGSLTRERHLPDRDLAVRAYPPLPELPAQAEDLMRGLMEPWLAGDGGLVLDAAGGWTITSSADGHRHAEGILTALSDPHPQAPHLIARATMPTAELPRPPAGTTLAAWCLDLGRLAAVDLAVGPDIDAGAQPPTGAPVSLADALRLLAAAGVRSAFIHGTVCVSTQPPEDRQHPAERARIAMLPTWHLTRDPELLARLAAQLRERVVPAAWSQPGWRIVALPARGALLVVAAPEAIHAVMTALEAADQAGLAAWLH